METTPSLCITCNTTLNGKYCHNCGEQMLDKETRSIGYLSEAFVSEISSLDSKILTTIKLFFLRPGKQVQDFHLGIRKSYFSLISLFFLFNLLFFLNNTMTDFSLSLAEQLHQPYSSIIKPAVEKSEKINNIEFKRLQTKYDAMSETIAKSIIIVSVPLFAIFIAGLNYKRDYYLQDHIMFALNIYAFVLIWPILFRFTLNLISWLIPLPSILRENYFTILALGVVTFIWFAQKNAYACSKLEASLKLIPLLLLLFISHMMYRFVQFWLTWWQIS
jgi:hypothetical protein